LRLYASGDSAAYNGPPYIKILFVNGDLTCPIGRNRPEETLVLDRMKFDSNTHFVQGSDAAIAEPLPMSFSFRAFDQAAGTELMTWISDHKGYSGGSTLTSTKGTSGLKDYNGTYWKTNAFTDSSKVCFDVEVKFAASLVSGKYGSDLTVKLHEVLFNQGDQTLNEGEDAVNVNLSGMIYGSIEFGSVDFTTGSAV
jgi:hypothetical protein